MVHNEFLQASRSSSLWSSLDQDGSLINTQSSCTRYASRHFVLYLVVWMSPPSDLWLLFLNPVNNQLWRKYSSKKVESDQEFDDRWEAYFNREDIDTWELRKGLNDLYGHDLVPEPRIVSAMLKAARRLDDLPMAVRILEAVKQKAAGDEKIYSYIIGEIRPILDDLGLKTPEELGLA